MNKTVIDIQSIKSEIKWYIDTSSGDDEFISGLVKALSIIEKYEKE